MKRAVFRVDGAPFIGIGHIMRCLTLAEKLRGAGWGVQFISRGFENHFAGIIADKGFSLSLLPAPETMLVQSNEQSPPHAHWLGVDWLMDAQDTSEAFEYCDMLIVDHYGIDARWHTHLRDKASRIFVIDDLADRPLDCDIVLDQTYDRAPEDYNRVAPSSLKLCGSAYMLLRDIFAKKRQAALNKRKSLKKIENIFICLGSGDPENTTGLVLQGLEEVEGPLKINIILSSKAMHLKDVQEFQSHHSVHIHLDCPNVEDLMIEADIAYGAGGTMSWERCCLGLPTFVIEIAENQKMIAQKLHDAGAVYNLGWWSDVSAQDIGQRFNALRVDDLQEMSVKAASICDGHGAQKVLEILDAD